MINTALFESLERLERYDKVFKYVVKEEEIGMLPIEVRRVVVEAQAREMSFLRMNLSAWLEDPYFAQMLEYYK